MRTKLDIIVNDETLDYARRAYPLYRAHLVKWGRSLVLYREIMAKCIRLRRIIYAR
jgi:hypothetical protein